MSALVFSWCCGGQGRVKLPPPNAGQLTEFFQDYRTLDDIHRTWAAFELPLATDFNSVVHTQHDNIVRL
jgi:hypothetical protein